jgi:hypothetical protein
MNLFNLITILNYFHFLTQENIGFKLSEIMVGSGIRKKTYSGSRIQGSKRYRIPDPDPQHCKKVNKLGKVKCAFAAERHVPEQMKSFMSEICSK